MKTFKKILIVLAGIVALLLIIAIFIPKDLKIGSEVVINKPVGEVFQYVSHLKNQDYYSKWNMADMNKKQTFKGTDGTLGFVNTWEGNKDVGKGEQEITGIVPNKRVDIEVRFKEPMESTMQGYFITDAIDANTTKVTWGMSGDDTPWPRNIMNPLFKAMLGGDMQESLNNLKKNLEK
jgi:uncharacterized protein YndB with AHSA1/START domain